MPQPHAPAGARETPAQARTDAATGNAGSSVRAPLCFIVPQATKPYFKSSALTGGLPEVHFQTEQREVTLHDLRQRGASLSLEQDGFELHRHRSRVNDFYDDAAIRAVYEPELQVLLEQLTGARQVVIFDHTRRSDAPDGASNQDGLRGPATRVHVDYTVESGPKRARDVLGEATVRDTLARGGRIVQVNVWRPVKGPVRRAPLALAAADSVPRASLVATDQLFPDRVGEIYQVAYDPAQRWYWAPAMTPEEVLLIKGWDSDDSRQAVFTPHGAFDLPGQRPEDPPRESIETRTFLLFDN